MEKMHNHTYILAIDQGTSSTKTLLVDHTGSVVANANVPLQTYYLANGHVEQNPQEIIDCVLQSVQACVDTLVKQGRSALDIVSVGISNQRETFLLWDRGGKPLCNAIVWQCKRSIEICNALNQRGLASWIKERTGLFIDPYFSGTKLLWLLQHDDMIKHAVASGNAYFGTVDTWLLYRFTNGKRYCTDYTNASRTMLFNLKSLRWDADVLDEFDLSALNLPSKIAKSKCTKIRGLNKNKMYHF